MQKRLFPNATYRKMNNIVLIRCSSFQYYMRLRCFLVFLSIEQIKTFQICHLCVSHAELSKIKKLFLIAWCDFKVNTFPRVNLWILSEFSGSGMFSDQSHRFLPLLHLNWISFVVKRCKKPPDSNWLHRRNEKINWWYILDQTSNLIGAKRHFSTYFIMQNLFND